MVSPGKRETGVELTRITDENSQWFRGMLGPELESQLSKRADFGAIGALERDVACGALVFCEQKTHISIEYLIVADEFRREGVGAALVAYLCERAAEREKLVYVFFLSPEGRELHGFFSSLPGFYVQQADALCYRISLAELAEKNALDSLNLPRVETQFLTLPKKVQNDFYRRQGLLEDGIVHPEDFLDTLCLATVDGGALTSCALVEKGTKDGLYLSYVWVQKGYERSVMAVLCEIRARIAEKNRCSDKFLYISAVNPESKHLLQHLFPKLRPCGAYWEASFDPTLAV